MANAKKCDRCGAFYEDQQKVQFIVTNSAFFNYCDLCPKCSKELVEWAKDKKGFITKRKLFKGAKKCYK